MAPSGRRRSPEPTRSSCRRDGRRALFVPGALQDGPLPAHYEAAESPLRNDMYKQDTSPVGVLYTGDAGRRTTNWPGTMRRSRTS